MFTEAYLEPSQTSTIKLSLLWLSHILKTYLIRSIFFFWNLKLNNGITSSQKNEQRRFFKLASVKSAKTYCVCILYFFHYFKHYSQNIVSRTTVSYLIAKVERKENSLFKTWNYHVSERKEK